MKKENHFIHFLYAGSLLLSVLIIVGYWVWSKNQDSLIEKKRSLEKAHLEEKRRVETARCLSGAYQAYSASWDYSCKVLYGYKPNCSLPFAVAKELNGYLRAEEKLCTNAR